MNTSLRISLLCFCIGSPSLHAGVREDFPDFFPKEPEPPAEKNGWSLLPALKKISPQHRKGLPGIGQFDPATLASLNGEKVHQVATLYAENLGILDRIMDAPYLQSDHWRTFKLNGPDSFDFLRATTTVQLALWKAIVDAREGDAGKGVETGLRVIRFGLKACEAEPMLVDLGAGSMIIKMGAGAVAHIAALPGTDGNALRKTAKDLDACDTAGAAIRKGIKGEARWSLLFFEPLLQGGQARRDTVIELAVMNEVLSSFFDKGAGKKKDERVTDEALREKWKKELPDSVKSALRDADKIDWGALTQSQSDYFRALTKADNRSLPAFKASFHPPDIDAALKGTALEPYFQSKMGIDTGEVYLHFVAGASAYIRVTRAILLLRVFQLDHGRLPASLDELTPAYWLSVPADPYDGKPLRYDAATRMVWAVGMNLKDEKGENRDKGKEEPDDISLTLPEVK